MVFQLTSMTNIGQNPFITRNKVFMSKVTKNLISPGCPNRLCQTVGERTTKFELDDREEVEDKEYTSLVLLYLIIIFPVQRSFTEKPKGSNSIDT